ncbi:hypothetical protein HJB84_22520 [Rhizobium sp. NZLR1b]|uniref:hypothetical protein n=1 Tax=Rhizobium sp. NZLR1b TaxID=2731099 RepID=UPI001C831FB5|nr:hypothetical protein [Rhizobium sp. NZLR1b]MBX5172610.1 hypothetical protein [Rhizobium sp. NZLR1b]
MIHDIFKLIQELEGGWPELLGSLAGSAIGLVSLMLGALYNARLNRNADRERERNDKFGIVEALLAEIASVKATLDKAAVGLLRMNPNEGYFPIPDPYPGIGIFQKFIDRIELFDEETIRAVSELYTVLDEYCGQLRVYGSHFDASLKGKVVMAASHPVAAFIIPLNQSLSQKCADVLSHLRFQRIKNHHLLSRLSM